MPLCAKVGWSLTTIISYCTAPAGVAYKHVGKQFPKQSHFASQVYIRRGRSEPEKYRMTVEIAEHKIQIPT